MLASLPSSVLVERNADLPLRVARSYAAGQSAAFVEEMSGVAGLALVEAAGRWRPDGGAPFRAFAWQRMRGAIADELRRQDHLTRRERDAAKSTGVAVRERPVSLDDDQLVAVDDRDAIAALAERELLRVALVSLSQRERLVWFLCVVAERTQQEVGEQLGVSESRISQICSRAQYRLRRALAC